MGLGRGAVEFGEKTEDALQREIREEYGTDVLEFDFLGFMDVHRVDHERNKTHWVALCYKVLVDREKVKNASPKDHDEIGWFTLDNLPNPVHSQLPTFLEKYKKIGCKIAPFMSRIDYCPNRYDMGKAN